MSSCAQSGDHCSLSLSSFGIPRLLSLKNFSVKIEQRFVYLTDASVVVYWMDSSTLFFGDASATM
jgi:hypothetical protein